MLNVKCYITIYRNVTLLCYISQWQLGLELVTNSDLPRDLAFWGQLYSDRPRGTKKRSRRHQHVIRNWTKYTGSHPNSSKKSSGSSPVGRIAKTTGIQLPNGGSAVPQASPKSSQSHPQVTGNYPGGIKMSSESDQNTPGSHHNTSA